MVDTHEETLADLPPSSKLVYFVLKQHGPMTQSDIAEASLLSPRTVRDGINRLEEIDIVTERIHIKDARQHIYETSAADSDPGQRSAMTAADD